jgi:hypothetical protein
MGAIPTNRTEGIRLAEIIATIEPNTIAALRERGRG